jgi:hypothetical protein
MWSEAAQACRFEGIDDAEHKGCLRADDGEIDRFSLRERYQSCDIIDRNGDIAQFGLASCPCITGRNHDFSDSRRLCAFPSERMFAPATADDHHFHRAMPQ